MLHALNKVHTWQYTKLTMRGVSEIKTQKNMIKNRISYRIRLARSLILKRVEWQLTFQTLLRWPPNIIYPPIMISRPKGVTKYSLLHRS